MSPLNDWNNTKLIVQHHHNDLYSLTTPKALLDEPTAAQPAQKPSIVKQSILLIVAIFTSLLD